MNKNMRQPDEDGDNSLAEIKNMDVGLGACSSLTTTGRAPSDTGTVPSSRCVLCISSSLHPLLLRAIRLHNANDYKHSAQQISLLFLPTKTVIALTTRTFIRHL